jgi:hypothetical protein
VKETRYVSETLKLFVTIMLFVLKEPSGGFGAIRNLSPKRDKVSMSSEGTIRTYVSMGNVCVVGEGLLAPGNYWKWRRPKAHRIMSPWAYGPKGPRA